MSAYQKRISELTQADPRLVEAWMRLECGTLDRLSPHQFAVVAHIAARMVTDYPQESRKLADSYGLIPARLAKFEGRFHPYREDTPDLSLEQVLAEARGETL